MNYKDAITAEMDTLAADPRTVFIGYGVKTGRANGTLKNVAASQLLETPVAENLMCGIATGLAIAGRKPVVFIERFDFALCAADAIINHAAKVGSISRNEFTAGVIYRCVVGNTKKPLFTGATHTQNFTRAFRFMGLEVLPLKLAEDVPEAYQCARDYAGAGRPIMLVEHKDLY